MKYFEKLIEIQKKAYALYSNYKVAAIVVNDKKELFFGVNVENASYGLSMCAERNAISSAVLNASTKIIEVHILCSNLKSFGTPCGACRQVIAEFMDDDGKIIIYNNEGKTIEYKFSEILPLTFRKTYFNKE